MGYLSRPKMIPKHVYVFGPLFRHLKSIFNPTIAGTEILLSNTSFLVCSYAH
jgi:hypothetical protein